MRAHRHGLAQAFGAHSGVVAWQIDNEYGCHDTVESYSPAARLAFRLWCERKYGEIAALNRAWGNVFWSMELASFDEIALPESHSDGGQSRLPARLPAFLVGSGRSLSPASGRDRPPPFARPRHSPQLHGRVHRLRSLCARTRSRRRRMGQLSARLSRTLASRRGLQAPLHAGGRSRLSVLPSRSLSRLRAGALMDHGAAAGGGELGAVESVAGERRRAHVDLRGLRGGRRGRELFSLASGAFRARADA